MSSLKRVQMSKRWMALALAAAVVGSWSMVSLAGAEDPPIIKHMEEINSGYKSLRREARRLSFNEESIATVINMQEHALKAMHVPFKMAEKVSGDAKKKMIAGYKKVQGQLVIELINLEIALEEGRKEDAKALVEKLGALKKEGHDKYVEE